MCLEHETLSVVLKSFLQAALACSQSGTFIHLSLFLFHYVSVSLTHKNTHADTHTHTIT